MFFQFDSTRSQQSRSVYARSVRSECHCRDSRTRRSSVGRQCHQVNGSPLLPLTTLVRSRYHFDALAEANDAQNMQDHIVDRIEPIPVISLAAQR